MSKRIASAERAVEGFEEANTELQEFMDDNDDFIDELRRLVDNRNASIKSAGAAVKASLRTSDRDKLQVGRFGAQKKKKEYWDGQDLLALLPKKTSKHFLKEVKSYEVNVTKLEQMIRQGEVDRDEAFKAWHQDTPTIALLPGCPKAMVF
jgi:hypothetical protein